MSKEIHLAKLKEPFEPDRVSWRIGSTNREKTKGLALAFIDARDVMHRLDEVCGPENWQCDYPHAGAKTVCRIGIRINGEWIWKSNGAGDTDIESEKGALSDAFKRAAVLWGVGQYLYDLDAPWVELEPKGNSYVIARKEYAKLHALLGGRNSSQLKKEDAWTAFQNDLWGCTTVIQIENLYRELRKEGWPAPWLQEAADACAKRKADLMNNDNDFNSDRPTGAVANMMAG